MPNDLVSREAVMAAVLNLIEKQLGLRGKPHYWRERLETAIAALPAAGDERWEKLRAFVVELGAENVDCIRPDYFDATEDILAEMAELDGITWEQHMERTRQSPPPQEAGDDQPGPNSQPTQSR